MQCPKNKTITETPVPVMDMFKTEIRYLKVKDVKRVYSKLIQEYCKGNVPNDKAKTLGYLLAGYIQTVKQYEMDERITELEKRVQIGI